MTTINPLIYGAAMPLARDPEIPDLVSLTEAAAILQSTRPAAFKRATRGNMPGAQAGTTFVFRREVVEEIAARELAKKATKEASDVERADHDDEGA